MVPVLQNGPSGEYMEQEDKGPTTPPDNVGTSPPVPGTSPPGRVTAALHTCGFGGNSGPIPSPKTFVEVPPDQEVYCLACGKGSHTRSQTQTRDRTGRLVSKSIRMHKVFESHESGRCLLCEACLNDLRYELMDQARGSGT